jgi:ClpP class serine protease
MYDEPNKQLAEQEKETLVLKTKSVPVKNTFSRIEGIRPIDIDPPVVLANAQMGLRRLTKEKNLVDKNGGKQGFIIK